MAKALADEGFAEKVTARQAVKKLAWARNPGQLSVEPASEDRTTLELQRIALRAHQEARQAIDLRKDLARRVMPSVWRDAMELVVRHELIGKESLIFNDSLRNTVVLLSLLWECVQRLGRFQTRKGRSPQEVSGTINYDQGKISLRAKLDFLVIDKNQIT